MPGLRRIYNVLRYGLGDSGRERKRVAKETARREKFASQRWQRDQDLVTRNYASYSEYLEHQAGKLDKITGRLLETEKEDLAEFQRRFQTCEVLKEARSVLCLGARLGTEVKALHELGYFAIGIDLNPGSENQYVLPGDFHHIVFADGSVDAIYCNALDHVYELDRAISEIKPLLRPRGLFVADLIAGFEEGFIPGEYEATHWKTAEEFGQQIAELGGFTIEGQRDLGHHRRDQWYQMVFRKPA
jgi:SAM-dependent methyltransferase